MDNSLANLEALLNIGANLSEILGIGAGMHLFIGSSVVLAKGFGRAKQWALCGILLIISALAIPGIINLLVPINLLVGLVVSWSCAITMTVWGFHIWFLPYTIAKTDGKGHWGMLTACVLSAPVPLIWLVCVWFALAEKNEKSFAAASAVPPILPMLFARITGREGRKTLGCQQPHVALAEPPRDFER